MGKKTVTTTQEIDEEEASTPTEPLDSDEIRALTDLEGAGEVTWSVHRTSQPGAGFMGELSTAELSHSNIARLYGGGVYRVKGTRPNGTYFKSGRIMISPQYRDQNAPPSSGIDAEALKQQLSKDNFLPLLIAMMNSNTQVVTAALSRPQEPKREFPWPQLLIAAPALLTSIKEFMKTDGQGESIEKLIKTMELLDKLKGDDAKGSTWPDVLREAMSNVPALVSSARGTTPVATAPTAQPVVAHVVDRTPVAVSAAVDNAPTGDTLQTPIAVEPTEEMVTLEFLRTRLSDLIDAASKNRNPELQADLLLEDFERLPPIISDAMVRNVLDREDWFEQLQKFEPRVANYYGWFDSLRKAVLDAFNEDEDTDATASG